MSKELVESIAQEYGAQLLEYRNHLHENPELSFEEYETSKYIKEKLKALGLEPWENITGNSVVVEIDSGVEGPTVLFRADMDALPVPEETEWEHKSKIPGAMHACGHDTHTAILLNVADAVVKHKSQLLKRGKVRLCYQQAEELVPGGAVQMVRDGAAEGATMGFALHAGKGKDDTITVCRGFSHAAIGTFSVKVIGQGGHTSSPYAANDPVPALIDIASAIQRMVPNRIDNTVPAVVMVASVVVGNPERPNIIPGFGTVGGTIRTARTEDRTRCLEQIEKLAKGICEAYGVKCELDLQVGYPAMHISDPQQDIVVASARELGIEVIEKKGGLGGEDFAYFGDAIPSAFYSVAMGDPEDPKYQGPGHSSTFFIDESKIINGLKMTLEILLQATAE